jgi:hypothetical protein
MVEVAERRPPTGYLFQAYIIERERYARSGLEMAVLRLPRS